MKKIIMIAAMLITTVTFGQNKNAKGTLEVDGVCMMCKARIEKACLTSKGVKTANWDVKTHELKVIYDDRKTNLKTISQTIASAGHDTKTIKAKDDVYSSINACCQYRDETVVDAHGDGKEH